MDMKAFPMYLGNTKRCKQPASIQTSCPTLAEVPKVQGTVESTAAEFSLTWTFIERNGDQHAVKQLMLKRGHGVCHKNVSASACSLRVAFTHNDWKKTHIILKRS